MATYDLKYPGAAIDAILDTAYDLQNAGYIFRGLASEYSNTPTERSWVLAGEGETGHGFTSPIPKGYIGVCVFNGTSWTGKLLKCVSIDSTPTSGSTNAISSGGAYTSISQLATTVNEALDNLTFTDTTPSAFLGEYITEKVSTTDDGIERILTYFTILSATASKAGLLSAADKAKLDALWSSGYQFAGIATPSTTPISTTSKIFYIATEAGTYFNAVTVTQGINILSWDGTSWSTTQIIGIDDEPTADSDNLVKSGGVYGVNHTLSGTSTLLLQANQYVRNIYILPRTQQKYNYLKSLSAKAIRMSYFGLNVNFGGDAVFGLQITTTNTAANYRINYTPDLSKSLIVHIDIVGGGSSGELASDIDVYVEFNPKIDFTATTGIVGTAVYIDILDVTQVPLFYEIVKNGKDIDSLVTSVNGKTDKIYHNEILQTTEYLQSAKIDYRSLMRIAKFEGNLFDKTRAIEGYFASGAGYEANATYFAASVPMPLELGQTYICNNKNTSHIQILKVSDLSAVIHIANGSSSWGAHTEGDNILFTVPSDLGYDVCALVSCHYSNLNNTTFNKGTSLTSNPFIISFGGDIQGETIIVDQSEYGDYTTIADAISNSKEGQTIYIKNGVYNECLKIASRRVHLVGESMEGTILCYSGKDYANPPMEIAKGFVENLTIMALNEGTAGSSPAYCAHIDSSYSKDEVLEFRNVKFVSETYQVVGIGLLPNFKLSFINCWFISKNSYDAFYCHDCESDAFSDYSGQQLILDSCRFYTDSSWGTIRLQTQEKHIGVVKAIFVNNIVYSDNPRPIYMTFFHESIGGGGYLNSSDWVLDKISAQNTTNLMNYSNS